MKKTAILFSLLLWISCDCRKSIKRQAEVTTVGLHAMPMIGADISDPTNALSGNIETLTLKYIVWGCVCPNWITLADFETYQDEALGEHCIFIEPASEELTLPSDFDLFENFIQVTGQFYVNPDYPKGTRGGEQQPLHKAKVFRYTEFEIIEIPAD